VPYETLRYDVADAIATIALDQPDTRNALSDVLLDELLAALAAARDDAAVRVVVLASTHETVFSSGGDLAGFATQMSPAERYAANGRFPRLFTLIGELGKPVICAARGHVLAGALGLALACDLVIAGERATFGTPEINVGLFPFMIAALIARNVGRKKLTELLLLGERIDADEALRLGIVNRVVAAGEFDATVAEWAAKLAAKSPLLLKLGKDALFAQQDMALGDALAYAQAQLVLGQTSQDAHEGISAFLERREPQWKGR
jgi:enoyl-CoA hydratase